MFGPEHFPRNLRAVEELKTLADKYHRTLPQFALRWTLSQPAIHTGLVGFRRAAEVEENVGALDFSISQDDMAAIDAIFARNDVVTEPPGWLEDDPVA
jgi:aryl-alcohol dehydrogenase-like predicted oxidoreductase